MTGVTSTFPTGHNNVTVSETGHNNVTVGGTGHNNVTVSETGHTTVDLNLTSLVVVRAYYGLQYFANTHI